MAIFLFIFFPRQQVILSDCDLLGPEIHHEGFTSQQLGSDKDVLSFSRNAVDWTPLPVKDSLSEVDFLLHQSSRGNLKLFRPDSKPFAPNQKASRNTQIAIEPCVNDGSKISRAIAKD
jgi:hypothetical protein